MSNATAGARSFSPPFKGLYTDVPTGGEWQPYQHHSDYRSNYINGSRGQASTKTEPLKPSAGKMPAYQQDDSSRRLDVSKLFENVPMSHKSFLDPEYEAEMLKHKRDVLQSVVDSHGTKIRLTVTEFH